MPGATEDARGNSRSQCSKKRPEATEKARGYQKRPGATQETRGYQKRLGATQKTRGYRRDQGLQKIPVATIDVWDKDNRRGQSQQ